VTGVDAQPEIIELLYFDALGHDLHCRGRVIDATNRTAELLQSPDIDGYAKGDRVCYQRQPGKIFPIITGKLARPEDDETVSIVPFARKP